MNLKWIARGFVVGSALLTIPDTTRPAGALLCVMFGVTLVASTVAFFMLSWHPGFEHGDRGKAVSVMAIGVALLALAGLTA